MATCEKAVEECLVQVRAAADDGLRSITYYLFPGYFEQHDLSVCTKFIEDRLQKLGFSCSYGTENGEDDGDFVLKRAYLLVAF